MDVLTEDVRDNSLMKMIRADDLVLRLESVQFVMTKYDNVKKAFERKGLSNTKVMKLVGFLSTGCCCCCYKLMIGNNNNNNNNNNNIIK